MAFQPLSKEYLLKRGYCCNNGCKNCPYKTTAMKTPLQKLIERLSPEQEGVRLMAVDLLKDEEEMIEQVYKEGRMHGRDRRETLNYYQARFNQNKEAP